MVIHPAIYARSGKILPGDPREDFMLVQIPGPKWGMETIQKFRFREAMNEIAPRIANHPAN